MRPRPSIRTARLEAKAAEAELKSGSSTAVGGAWREAEERAEPGEIEELERLRNLAGQLEYGSREWTEAAVAHNELEERIMGRVSGVLAAEIRLRRDLPAHSLRALQEEAIRNYEEHSERGPVYRAGATPEEAAREWCKQLSTLFQRPYDLGTVLWLREHLVRSGAAEPVSDLLEAGDLLERVLEALDRGDEEGASGIARGERG